MATFGTSYQNTYASFKTDDFDRLGFIRKVYAILSCQLLFTTLVVGCVCASSRLEKALISNSWLILLSSVGTLVTSLTMFFFPKLTHKVPLNYSLLGGFTFFESILVASVCVKYEPVSVFISALMACSVTLALTAYAFTTKKDFSQAVGIMLVVSLSALFFAVFMPFVMRNPQVQFLYCVAFTVIYGIYIIIDTQKILGGGQYNLKSDDYILGSLILYIDVVGLFIHILRLLGEEKDKKRK
mmetsp:Transcript_9571/g.18652  ORF Transcript_9571/g.18652 Transcript_9571/m.18652 type:complete len:241 (-) Transcript_9571:828-1550(-)